MTAGTATPLELRQEQRFSLQPSAELPIQVSKDGVDETGEAVDISFSGAKVRLTEALAPKTEVELRIQGIDGVRVAEACWSRPAPDGAWWVGFQFHEKLSKEMIDALADQGIIDRRQDARRFMSVTGTARYQLDGEAKTVRLVNMSSGGFSLIAPDPPGDSQRLMLTIGARHARNPVTVPARIAWSQETSEGHQLGCQFTQRDSSQKMHAALLAPKKSVLASWKPNQDTTRTAILVAVLIMTWSLWLITNR